MVRYFEDGYSVRGEFNVPPELQSCHITVLGDYYVEGHVPFEILEKLVTEKPDIDGLVLPGMPEGSPGMPGTQDEDLVVLAVKDGQTYEYARIPN